MLPGGLADRPLLPPPPSSLSQLEAGHEVGKLDLVPSGHQLCSHSQGPPVPSRALFLRVQQTSRPTTQNSLMPWPWMGTEVGLGPHGGGRWCLRWGSPSYSPPPRPAAQPPGSKLWPEVFLCNLKGVLGELLPRSRVCADIVNTSTHMLTHSHVLGSGTLSRKAGPFPRLGQGWGAARGLSRCIGARLIFLEWWLTLPRLEAAF